MGMFDSVWFACPNCGERMEAQSKGGECLCNDYSPNQVPYDVATDAHIHRPCKCGKAYRIKPFYPTYVAMELEEIEVPKGTKFLPRHNNRLEQPTKTRD